VLVSDAGGDARIRAREDWAQHAVRVLDLIDNQVRSLRKRQVVDALCAGSARARTASARTFGTISPDGPRLSLRPNHGAANTPTRIKRMGDDLQERLINWGYAVCDAALRRHVDGAIPAPGRFPYTAVGV
jgi:NTE family protein